MATDYDKYSQTKAKYLTLPPTKIGLALHNFAENQSHYLHGIDQYSIFQCASLSKEVFAIIVIKMMLDGKIDLDKTIYDYLTVDELNMMNINEKFDKRYRDIKLKMLLSHTSGLPFNGRYNTLKFAPGTGYQYSGNAFGLLQKIVEKLEQKTLNELYDSYRMKNSSFMFEYRFDKTLAMPYDKEATSESYRTDLLQPFSGGTLYSNLEDYVTFIKGHTEIIKIMMEKQFVINKNISVGLGCMLYDDFIWQWGDNKYYKNFLLFNPHKNTGFISLSNNTKGWSLIKKIIPNDILNFLTTYQKYDMQN